MKTERAKPLSEQINDLRILIHTRNFVGAYRALDRLEAVAEAQSQKTTEERKELVILRDFKRQCTNMFESHNQTEYNFFMGVLAASDKKLAEMIWSNEAQIAKEKLSMNTGEERR